MKELWVEIEKCGLKMVGYMAKASTQSIDKKKGDQKKYIVIQLLLSPVTFALSAFILSLMDFPEKLAFPLSAVIIFGLPITRLINFKLIYIIIPLILLIPQVMKKNLLSGGQHLTTGIVIIAAISILSILLTLFFIYGFSFCFQKYRNWVASKGRTIKVASWIFFGLFLFGSLFLTGYLTPPGTLGRLLLMTESDPDSRLNSAVSLLRIDIIDECLRNEADIKGSLSRTIDMVDYMKDSNEFKILKSEKTSSLEEVVKFLLAKGASPNEVSYDKESPLHIASYLNKREVIKILIDNGANVNAEDDMKKTPLHRAVDSLTARSICFDCINYSDEEVSKTLALLLENGADINVKNKNFETPLQSLLKKKNIPTDKCAKVLIDAGAE